MNNVIQSERKCIVSIIISDVVKLLNHEVNPKLLPLKDILNYINPSDRCTVIVTKCNYYTNNCPQDIIYTQSDHYNTQSDHYNTQSDHYNTQSDHYNTQTEVPLTQIYINKFKLYILELYEYIKGNDTWTTEQFFHINKEDRKYLDTYRNIKVSDSKLRRYGFLVSNKKWYYRFLYSDERMIFCKDMDMMSFKLSKYNWVRSTDLDGNKSKQVLYKPENCIDLIVSTRKKNIEHDIITWISPNSGLCNTINKFDIFGKSGIKYIHIHIYLIEIQNVIQRNNEYVYSCITPIINAPGRYPIYCNNKQTKMFFTIYELVEIPNDDLLNLDEFINNDDFII